MGTQNGTQTNGAALATIAAQVPQTVTTQQPASAATVEYDHRGEVVRVGFDTLAGFEALQRIGKAFAASSLVPDAYRGAQNLANCVIAIEMAARMGASPLMVMQNLYLVHGRPSWSSQYLIASFNQCGRFTAIKYRWTGERGKDSWGCIAYTREKETGDLIEGPEVTIGMAKKEGWYDKKGSKWQTIPQLMLTYRSAGFLIRTTAPELTMGLRTAEESEDIGMDAGAFDAAPPSGVHGLRTLVAQKAPQLEPAAMPQATPTEATPAVVTQDPPEDPNEPPLPEVG